MNTIITFLLYWASLSALALILVAGVWMLGWIIIYAHSAFSNWTRYVSRIE